MTQQAPFFWIKKVHTLIESSSIPLWGKNFKIDWEELKKKLSTALNIPITDIRKVRSEWIEEEELLLGMGSNPFIFPLRLMPISEPSFAILSEEDAEKWTRCFLDKNETSLVDKRLKEGFLFFLLAQTLTQLNHLSLFPGCSLRMLDTAKLPQTDAFCMEFVIHLKEETLFLRLICPKLFNIAFREHFLSQKVPFEPKADTMLTLSCSIGRVELPLQTLKEVTCGDFLVLDHCSFDIKTKRGSCEVLLRNTPILHARIKPSGLKISEFYDFIEDNMDSDLDIFGDDEEFNELEKAAMANTESLSSEKSLTSLADIPLTVHVEVARFPLSLEKLTQLSSGNIIEMDIQASQGVYLVVNGKRIARAELVQLGEVMGVRILELK